MDRLVKMLALLLLVIICAAVYRAGRYSQTAVAADCPVLGNNLIDNIDPNVLQNLRIGYRNAGGSDDCWLIATFLFRTPDFQNGSKMLQFFQTAAKQRIQPIIRVAANNNNSDWQSISSDVAGMDASTLNSAIAASGISVPVYAYFGNEPNLASEWGGAVDPVAFTNSFLAFSQGAQNFIPILPPLSLNGSDPQKFWSDVFGQIFNRFGTGTTANDRCQSTTDWLDRNIKGYAFTLFSDSTGGITADLGAAVGYLQNAGGQSGCSSGFPIDGKNLLVVEMGKPGGNSTADIMSFLPQAYAALLNSQFGSGIKAVTSYVRDPDGRMHAYYYLSLASGGNFSKSGQYNQLIVNLGGSTNHGNPYGDGAVTGPTYLPLGSIETCPQEIPTNSENSCVPTFNSSATCVSECSPPVQFSESLYISGGGCLSGRCSAQIGIQDQNRVQQTFLPFAGSLADYFAGVIDAEHQSPEQLDRLQQDLRSKVYPEEAFNLAGVAVKLTPTEVQDQLKCKFINYVKQKITSGANTKYANFMVYDKKITDLFGLCRATTTDKAAFDQKWGKYWFAIPLFPNDEAQGKIEFVSPSLFSIDPINVSLPELGRLAAATKLIQSALVPPEAIAKRSDDISKKPESSLPTFGGMVTPLISNVACTPTPEWKTFGYEGVAYDRGVTCNTEILEGTPDSKICTVGPYGELRCGRQNQPGMVAGKTYNAEQTVQVRTVFPYLFDIADQTITPATGLLRIFKPEDEVGAKLFEQNFAPIPASIADVHYFVVNANGLGIDDTNNKNGWQLFFYKLGGLVNARNFVVKLLSPGTR